MIIYYERYVVIQPGIAVKMKKESPLQKMDFLTEEEYLRYCLKAIPARKSIFR